LGRSLRFTRMSLSLSGIYAIKKGRGCSLRPLRTSACRGAQVALQQSPILRTGTQNGIRKENRDHTRSTNHPIILRGFLPEATNHLSCGFLREAIRTFLPFTCLEGSTKATFVRIDQNSIHTPPDHDLHYPLPTRNAGLAEKLVFSTVGPDWEIDPYFNGLAHFRPKLTLLPERAVKWWCGLAYN
jgi:hypothetical protein